MEDVDKEWETIRPGLLNDFINKRKRLKKSWNKKAGVKPHHYRK